MRSLQDQLNSIRTHNKQLHSESQQAQMNLSSAHGEHSAKLEDLADKLARAQKNNTQLESEKERMQEERSRLASELEIERKKAKQGGSALMNLEMVLDKAQADLAEQKARTKTTILEKDKRIHKMSDQVDMTSKLLDQKNTAVKALKKEQTRLGGRA